MSDRAIPLDWLPYFQRKNIDSIRALARAVGMHQSTAGRVVHGEKSSRESLRRVADYFGLPLGEVQRLRDEQPTRPFEVPPEADALTPKQREAVRAIILAMVEPYQKTEEAPVLRLAGRDAQLETSTTGGAD